MGAHEDYMVMRRAALHLEKAEGRLPSDTAAMVLLKRASANDLTFIRLLKAGVQDELIDLAWAVLGEQRPGGCAVQDPQEEVTS